MPASNAVTVFVIDQPSNGVSAVTPGAYRSPTSLPSCRTTTASVLRSDPGDSSATARSSTLRSAGGASDGAASPAVSTLSASAATGGSARPLPCTRNASSASAGAIVQPRPGRYSATVACSTPSPAASTVCRARSIRYVTKLNNGLIGFTSRANTARALPSPPASTRTHR